MDYSSNTPVDTSLYCYTPGSVSSMFNMPCRYISSVEENEGATVAVVSSPEPEYVVGSNGPKELKDPSRERFDLLMQVVTPFASLPLTKENIKSVKTAFILKNEACREDCPSLHLIRA